jgi:hypothetical protein
MVFLGGTKVPPQQNKGHFNTVPPQQAKATPIQSRLNKQRPLQYSHNEGSSALLTFPQGLKPHCLYGFSSAGLKSRPNKTNCTPTQPRPNKTKATPTQSRPNKTKATPIQSRPNKTSATLTGMRVVETHTLPRAADDVPSGLMFTEPRLEQLMDLPMQTLRRHGTPGRVPGVVVDQIIILGIAKVIRLTELP